MATEKAAIYGTVVRYNGDAFCYGPSGELTDYVEPCPSCRVWVDWNNKPPANRYGVYSLYGDVHFDYGQECQYIVVTTYWPCLQNSIESR